MRTLRIENDEWKKFAEEFSERWHGVVVSVEILAPSTGAQHRIDREPLREICVKPRDEGSNEVTVTTGIKSDWRSHTVEDVSAIWVEEDDEGVASCVELEDSGGAKTLISFPSRKAPKLHT